MPIAHSIELANNRSLSKARHQGLVGERGVMLIEAMIAVVIFSFSVLAIIGLQAAMIRNTSEARSRAEASSLAQKWIGQMWADPGNSAAYLVSKEDISSETTLPNPILSVSSTAPSIYQLTICWRQTLNPPRIEADLHKCDVDDHRYQSSFSIAGY